MYNVISRLLVPTRARHGSHCTPLGSAVVFLPEAPSPGFSPNTNLHSPWVSNVCERVDGELDNYLRFSLNPCLVSYLDATSHCDLLSLRRPSTHLSASSAFISHKRSFLISSLVAIAHHQIYFHRCSSCDARLQILFASPKTFSKPLSL